MAQAITEWFFRPLLQPVMQHTSQFPFYRRQMINGYQERLSVSFQAWVSYDVSPFPQLYDFHEIF